MNETTRTKIDLVKELDKLRKENTLYAKEKGQLEHDYRERVKELTCIHTFSEILTADGSIDETLRKLVNILPPAWQYPHVTCCRITYLDDAYESQHFRESKWVQLSNITSNGKVIGKIEIFYIAKMPASYEGPFMKDERALVNTIAERLGKVLLRKKNDRDLTRMRRIALENAPI